ncbi:MAG: TetR/AcrR family transcriptional regulator, partial [Desulfobacteraceae bacterium]|nr:TetR/AcrR family transcriptional regulator [Desulfobacteraceae bacterium]
LSPTQTSQATSTTEDNNDPLVNSIICFCMQGLTGTRR